MKTSYTPQEVRKLLDQLHELQEDKENKNLNDEAGTGYIFSAEYENILANWDYERWRNSRVPDVEEGVEYCKPLTGQTSFTIEPKPVRV